MKTIMISVLTICVMLADAVWAAQYPNTNSPLGTNVAAIADWNSELYFFDVARCWRGWENHGVTEGLMPPEQVDEFLAEHVRPILSANKALIGTEADIGL